MLGHLAEQLRQTEGLLLSHRLYFAAGYTSGSPLTGEGQVKVELGLNRGRRVHCVVVILDRDISVSSKFANQVAQQVDSLASHGW